MWSRRPSRWTGWSADADGDQLDHAGVDTCSGPLTAASPEKHDQILRDLVEFWIQEMKRPEGAKLDEQTLREALLKRLQIPPEKK